MAKNIGVVALLGLMSVLPACSPVMEANRPDPVDLSQFKAGQKRVNVESQLGKPETTLDDNGRSCDIYKLYTDGPGPYGRAGIAMGEIAVDVFTLGLSEALFTPVEAATKASRHAVLFCYDGENTLTTIREAVTPLDDKGAAHAH